MGNESLKQVAPPFTDNPNVWFLEQIVPPAIPAFYHHSERNLGGSCVPRTDWTERLAQIHRPSMTVVVPQRNEQTIATSIASLVLADKPPGLDIHILYVSNGCTDDSPDKIDAQMARFGVCEKVESNSLFTKKDGEPVDKFVDPNIDRLATTTSNGLVRMSHVRTTTPGKPNATNVGLRLALARGDRILTSTDANNTINPESLSSIFTNASQKFDGDTVILASGLYYFFSNNRFTRLMGCANTVRHHNSDHTKPPEHCTGGLYAVDTQWLESIGGVPNTLIEDHTLGLRAKYGGKKIQHGGGTVWSWGYASLEDRRKVYRRWKKGIPQERKYFCAQNVPQGNHTDTTPLNRIRQKIDGLLHRETPRESLLECLLYADYKLSPPKNMDPAVIEPTESTR